MKKSLSFGAVVVVASVSGHAATWTIGTANAIPGQQAQVSLALAGDGATAGAAIDLAFDEARLSLPVGGGEIPGANVSGQCARSSSKTVSAIIFAASGILPVTPQVVCNIPFTIRPSSRSGRIMLRASAKECATGTGMTSCVVAEGWIDVLGNRCRWRCSS